ncbi:MAG TPA: SDR family NAD(P)-dependent oxidoreductase [Burkholderiales bacterium]|nr:SDR family NAD(P)-dependent oxidoreductase [Burkholderiales bacterium]
MKTLPISKPARTTRVTSDLRELGLENRVALVTGAASGIGRATAQLLGGRGAAVALFDLSEERLRDTAAALVERGINVLALQGSATDPADCNAAAATCFKHFGRIDILVNSVGGSAIPVMPMWEVSDDQWNLMMDLNLKSAFNFCRAVIPYMLQRQYGRIVNIASTAGKEGNPNTAAYCAAKAGVISMTKSLGKELATAGIMVNAVTPAVVETEGTTTNDANPERRAQLDKMRAKIPMGRMGRSEEVARLIAFLASDHLSFSTGAVYDISGGRATY